MFTLHEEQTGHATNCHGAVGTFYAGLTSPDVPNQSGLSRKPASAVLRVSILRP